MEHDDVLKILKDEIKTRNATDCNEYGTISMKLHVVKVYSKIIHGRINRRSYSRQSIWAQTWRRSIKRI